jgi:two-component system chemotaxis response regulator CheB
MSTPGCDIVVIGGSAGALEPLIEILEAVPADLKVPIVVVMHVSARQPSLLPSLLAHRVSRRVVEPDDKEPIASETIYVAAPNYHLLVERTKTLSLSVDEAVNFSRPSVDVLFESAVDAYGTGVVGVVLSGANDDGAAGLARIAAAGGVAIIQAVSSAAHTAMPIAARQRVPNAHSLTPEEIAPFIAGLSRASLNEVMP